MGVFIFILLLLLTLAILFCGTVVYCFFKVFYSRELGRASGDDIYLPKGRVYEIHRGTLKKWRAAVRSMSHKKVQITSHDGLTLRGRYFEYKPGAPIELMLHGYRGSSDRDMNGGVLRAFAVGHNVLVVDNRGCGSSDGYISSFGVLETEDCLAWIDYIIDYIDFSSKIILTGVSMGAATVLMTACREELPQNVIGVLADCGYTSAEEIITKVVLEMRLPPKLVLPIIRLGGKILGKFDIRDASPVDLVKNCKLPVIFYHGDSDAFIPKEMSIKNFEESGAEYKKLVIIEGAGHGLCYVENPSKYLMELKNFFGPLTKDED